MKTRYLAYFVILATLVYGFKNRREVALEFGTSISNNCHIWIPSPVADWIPFMNKEKFFIKTKAGTLFYDFINHFGISDENGMLTYVSPSRVIVASQRSFGVVPHNFTETEMRSTSVFPKSLLVYFKDPSRWDVVKSIDGKWKMTSKMKSEERVVCNLGEDCKISIDKSFQELKNYPDKIQKLKSQGYFAQSARAHLEDLCETSSQVELKNLIREEKSYVEDKCGWNLAPLSIEGNSGLCDAIHNSFLPALRNFEDFGASNQASNQ